VTEPYLTKDDIHRLYEEYGASLNVDIDDELQAWGIEWEGVEAMMAFFVERTAKSFVEDPAQAFFTLCYVSFAMGVKCALELELRRQAR
jgi:hypothetical protein